MNPISRRQWLERITVPAFATTVGAGLITTQTRATERPLKGENNLLGARIYNVRDFGAKGDGKTLDSKAVQAAIDACSKDNGGTVLIPAGDFLIGTIELKSNVTLHVSAKGRLLGSTQRSDYERGNGVPTGNGNVVLLYAVNAENVTIEGFGTIDGNGKAFYTGHGDGTSPGAQPSPNANVDRPHMGIFYKCTNLRLRHAFFTQSAYHCLRMLECRQVNIDGLRIYNRINKNNDGFHFNSCEYVHISNCDVLCQDDACALFGSNKFVTVTNCSFSTRWSIFRFGGGASQNIAVSNCLIYETYGCPIKISAGRAQIENFTFSNIIMRNVTGPIGIGFGKRNDNNITNTTGGNAQQNDTTPKPFLRNIVFNGIRATVVPQPINHPDIPFEVKVNDGEQNSCITLNGFGDSYIENVSFTDVHVLYAGGGAPALAAKRDIPHVAAEYFGVWAAAPVGPPAYGLYARNVKGLTLQNVRFTYEKEEARAAIIFDNVQDAHINGLSVQGNSGSAPLLKFIDTKDVLLQGCRVTSACAVFMQVEGSANEGITIDGGDLRKANKLAAFENGAQEKSLKLRI